MENIENAVSEPLDFKIFVGEHASRPPTNLAPLSLIFKHSTWKYALDAVLHSGVQDSPPCVSIPMG